jgi:hypothetical protein
VTEALSVHQALHGYRNGHRLIASSTELSPEDKRFLSIVTDSADVGKTPGWDALLGGYALPSGRWYAVSVTWQGDAESRPGAVWTHTLLLDHVAVVASDKVQLLDLFTRPLPGSNYREFARALRVANDGGAPVRGYNEWAAEANWVLHQPPPRPVEVITNAESGRRQALLLALWFELWPELRWLWSFVETPTTRKVTWRGPFDIQLMSRPQGLPDDEVRVVRGSLARRPPEWAQVLADVRRGLSVSVHEFLDHYGPEADDQRAAVAPLAEIWAAIDRSRARPRADEVIELVALYFPRPNDMERLKRDLLRGQPVPGCETALGTADVLAALFAISGEAFGGEVLGETVVGTFRTATAGEARELVRLALQNPDAIAAPPVLDAAADSLTTRAPAWAVGHPEAVTALVKARLHLAADPLVWQVGEPDGLWKAVRSVRSRVGRARIVQAIVRSGVAVDEAEVIRDWPNASDFILESVGVGQVASGMSRWMAAVPTDDLVRWICEVIDADPGRLDALVAVVPTDTLVRLPLRALSPLVEDPGASHELLLAAFLRAIEDDSLTAAELATLSYGRLYPAALSSELGSAKSRLDTVDVDVPTWDAALRVARLLNRAYKRHPWPLHPILGLDEDSFTALIAADSKAGLARRIAAADLSPTSWQVAQLSEAIARRADADGVKHTIASLFWRAIGAQP